jgi:aldose 1-epimerase
MKLIIQSGQLKAEFLPELGMLGASLQYDGTEILRRIDDLESAARRGSSAGIPILYPWANRLSQFAFGIAGKKIQLERSSPLLHLDEQGLPLHGIPWSMLKWHAKSVEGDRITAELNWNTPDLLQIFPFAHHAEMIVVAQSDGLNIETKILADENSNVPISFGYHPYFGIQNLKRSEWKLKLPAMKTLLLNEQRIPTGATEEFAGFDDELGTNQFDDGFELVDQHSQFSIEGAGWKISLRILNGYSHAQIFAPRDKEFIALEPMTAPTNAVVSGKSLRILEPGEIFSASFKIAIEQSQA